MGAKKSKKTGTKISYLISKAIEKEINAEQVRILAALSDTTNLDPITREELRERTNSGVPGMYTGPWQKNVRELEYKGYIKSLKPLIGEGRMIKHYITPKGEKYLKDIIKRYITMAEEKTIVPANILQKEYGLPF